MTDEAWIMKYSPKSVDEMILSPEKKRFFQGIIHSGMPVNIILFGKPGIGKTTLAKIIVEQMKCDYLFQPCSMDGSIDMVKSTVKDFTETISSTKYKVVILDEADQLSPQAQMALRNIIVDSMSDGKNCRFILTANYEDKVLDPLKSRCQPIKLEFSLKEVLKYCSEILKKEGIKFDKDSLLDFNQNFVVKNFPDIRAILEKLQSSSLTGKLDYSQAEASDSRVNIAKKVRDLISSQESARDIRKMLIVNEEKFSSDYVSLAEALFDIYSEEGNDSAMALIAERLWRMSFILDKEIQFSGLLIELKNLLKENV